MPRGARMYARATSRAAMLLPGLSRLNQIRYLPFEVARRTCPYCWKQLPTPVGRDIHISLRPTCRARHKNFLKRKEKQKRKWLRKRRRPNSPPPPEPSESEPPTKRLRTESNTAPIAGPSRLPDPEPPIRLRAEGDGTYVEDYPVSTAGAPIGELHRNQEDLGNYLRSCGKLGDPELFETAEILMTTGLTGAGRTRHLQGPSYRKWKGKGKEVWPNDQALLRDIDNLPQGPKWMTAQVTVGEGLYKRKHTVYLRDILAVVRQLIGASRFRRCMHYVPERRWTSRERRCRVYDEMWTGDWWWRMQCAIGNTNGTVVPLIIASDETTLANDPSGAKAHPVYLSIGNISKSVRRRPTRRAMLLVGYLPVDSFSDIPENLRQRYHSELLHHSLREIFKPLKTASTEGILAWCADGRLRHIYPLIGAWIADWPEQNDLACTTQSGCPKCTQKRKGRSQGRRQAPLRDREESLKTLRTYLETKRSRALKSLDLRPIEPFWADIPHVDLGLSLAPDLLHQLYKGMFEHARNWAEILFGTKELDRRFKAMPAAKDLRHFKNGVTSVRNWAGRESRDMVRQFLPVVVDTQTPPDFVRMMRALLDFSYIAHGARLTELDLTEMSKALGMFHETKDALVKVGMIKSVDAFDRLAKLHMLSHYVEDIRELGTADGYSTETPEHLHIIYVKIPWRMSNRRNPIPQMIDYIRRLETIQVQRTAFDEYSGEREGADEVEVEQAQQLLEELSKRDGESGTRCEQEGEGEQEDEYEGDSVEEAELEQGEPGVSEPTYYPRPTICIARRPTARGVPGHVLASSYCASDLIRATQRFLLSATGHRAILLPSSRFDVWHKATLHHAPLPFAPAEPCHQDVIRIRPMTRDKAGHTKDAGLFDTALFAANCNGFGVARFRAGRVRAIFTLPPDLQHLRSDPLVLLDVYHTFMRDVSNTHGLFSTVQCTTNLGRSRASIVLPLSHLAMACHLAPDFSAPPTIDRYFFNDFYNHFTFLLSSYWRRLHAS